VIDGGAGALEGSWVGETETWGGSGSGLADWRAGGNVSASQVCQWQFVLMHPSSPDPAAPT
jgi:hypothetical protein